MKKLATLLSSIFILCLFSLPITAQDFEGVIHYEITNEATNKGFNKMPYMIKGNKARMEMGQGRTRAAIVILPEESKRYAIMPGIKGYMEMDMDMNTEQKNDDASSIKRTGETKTIAGKECEVWRSKTDNGIFDACMAQGMGTFVFATGGAAGNSEAPEWVRKFIEKGAVPLEVAEIRNGNRTIQMKATKIVEKSLSDDLFEVPEGYRDVSRMRQQMQNRQ